jgi:hypothetical protein
VKNRDKFLQSLTMAESMDKARFHPWAQAVKAGMWALKDEDGKPFVQSFVFTDKETLESILGTLDDLDAHGVLITGVSFSTGYVHYSYGNGTEPA